MIHDTPNALRSKYYVPPIFLFLDLLCCQILAAEQRQRSRCNVCCISHVSLLEPSIEGLPATAASRRSRQ